MGSYGAAAVLALGALQALMAPAQALALTITVDAEDEALGTTLAEAIAEANANPGHDTIDFDLAVPLLSVPAGGWPVLADAVTVDGGGEVRLDGGDGTVAGLVVTADDSVVQGLELTRFQTAVRLEGDDSVVRTSQVTDNVVGVLVADGAGSTVEDVGLERNGRGVQVVGPATDAHVSEVSALGNTIGVEATAGAAGTEVAASVFAQNHIGVHDDGATGTTVSGNRIGTDPTGTLRLGNEYGVASQTGLDLTVADNLVSGNSAYGVYALGAGADVTVSGNRVGVDETGENAIPNLWGVAVAVDRDSAVTVTENTVSASHYSGVHVSGAGEVTVTGNVFGSTVTRDLGNGSNGLHLDRVTGAVVDDNTLSGNARIMGGDGLAITDSSDVLVTGNRIGTAAVANSGSGLSLCGVSDATIGGDTAAEANVISGNGGSGVFVGWTGRVGCEVSESTISGNLIGVAADGTTPVPNAQHGVYVEVGNRLRLADNVVAHNGGAGIAVGSVNGVTNDAITVSANSVHDNGGLGIDLDVDGVTLNDPGDRDRGPNARQNVPVLQKATTTGATTTVRGVLDSRESRTYRVEFFAGPACDGSGYGEGRTFLGARTVTTDPAGHARVVATLPVAVPDGRQVTATATDLLRGDTSEFSRCVASRPAGVSVDDVGVVENVAGPVVATFTVTLSHAVDVAARVRVTTVDGTATRGNDYVPLDTVLGFAPGQTSRTVTVRVRHDRLTEPDETFSVRLSEPRRLVVVDGEGTGTIVDRVLAD